MKTLFLLLLALTGFQTFAQETVPPERQPISAPPKPESSEPQLQVVVDEHAEFPGGTAVMRVFIDNNLVYPPTALENEIEGKCYLKFVVNTDGSISNITVTRGVPDCPECDKEALRIVNLMPKWKPAKSGGKIVTSYFNLPITFKI